MKMLLPCVSLGFDRREVESCLRRNPDLTKNEGSHSSTGIRLLVQSETAASSCPPCKKNVFSPQKLHIYLTKLIHFVVPSPKDGLASYFTKEWNAHYSSNWKHDRRWKREIIYHLSTNSGQKMQFGMEWKPSSVSLFWSSWFFRWSFSTSGLVSSLNHH